MTEKGPLAKLAEKTRRRQAEEEDDFDRLDRGAKPSAIARSEPPVVPPPAPGRPKPSQKPTGGDRVHTSIYLPRDVWRRLRAIAAAEDCKVHDLIMEAVGSVVARRG